MVEEADTTAMDAVFHALAHGARRDMLGRLSARELTVGELAEPLTMSLAAASKHVKVLERAGLVRRTVDGRRHVCRLEPAPLASASAWLAFYEGHWTESLDALDAMVRQDAGAPAAAAAGSRRPPASDADPTPEEEDR